jgi:anti-anti-sigma factor
MGTCDNAGLPAGDRAFHRRRHHAAPALSVRWTTGYGDGAGDVQLRLSGEVDLVTWAELVTALDQAVEKAAAGMCRRVVVDTRELTFCDVRGVELLLAAGARLRTDGRALLVRRARPLLVRLFALIDSGSVVVVEADRG